MFIVQNFKNLPPFEALSPRSEFVQNRNRTLVSGWNLVYPVRDVVVDHGHLGTLCKQNLSAPLLTQRRPSCAIFPSVPQVCPWMYLHRRIFLTSKFFLIKNMQWNAHLKMMSLIFGSGRIRILICSNTGNSSIELTELNRG